MMKSRLNIVVYLTTKVIIYYAQICTIMNNIKYTLCAEISGSKIHCFLAVPLQACSGTEGSRKLRSPDFMPTAQDGGKVSLTHGPPLPPGNAPGTHFC